MLTVDPGTPHARAGVLVAWSGGLDSTVLLHLTRAWAARHGAPIAAVHVDHALRPTSRQDAAFCRGESARLGVALHVETLDVHPQGSTQQSARLQRYAALARVAASLGFRVILTAHHADDALETALMNLRRGTASGGLSALLRSGSAPVPDWPDDLEIQRPMLNYTRAQILEFARSAGIRWHEDPTNATGDYARNRLRHQLIPLLSEDGAHAAGMRATLQNLADEHEALQAMAEATARHAMLDAPDCESVALLTEVLRATPSAIISMVLQRAADRLPGRVSMTRAHLHDLTDAVQRAAPLQLAIVGGVAHVSAHIVLIELAHARGGRDLHNRRAESIAFHGNKFVHDTNLRHYPWFGTTIGWHDAARIAAEPDARHATPDAAPHAVGIFDYLPDTDQALIIRAPQPGDRLEVTAMSGHKMVADLLREAGVPRFLRWRWPCLAHADGETIVWVCGIRAAQPQPQEGVDEDASRRKQVIRWSLGEKSIFGAVLRNPEH